MRNETKDFEPAHVRAITACAVAFWHGRFYLGMDEQFERELTKKTINIVLRDLPTQAEISDVNRGIDRLSSWCDEHPKNFIQYGEKSDAALSALSFNETSGIQFSDGRVAFFSNAFRRICEEELHLPSYEKFLNELFDTSTLICPNRREKRKSLKISNSVKKVYMFKAGTLITLAETDEKEDKEYGA